MAGSKGSRQSSDPGLPELLGRALLDMASQVFGGRMDRAAWPPESEDKPQRPPQEPDPHMPEDPAREAAEVLERALTQTESLLERIEEPNDPPDVASLIEEFRDLQASARGVLQDLMESTILLQAERGRLAEEVTRLAEVARQLEHSAVQPTAKGQEHVDSRGEPSFVPGNGSLGLIVGGVPGFQGLMDTQRGLTTLPAVASASVQSYRNGEASLEVVLLDAVTPAQVVDQVAQATGHGLLIEEVRPEAHRLRLRFVDGS